MIVISGALVLVALVLLLIGLLQPELAFVYASIVVSLVSFVFLIIGILQRRGEVPGEDVAPATTDAPVAAEGTSKRGLPFGLGKKAEPAPLPSEPVTVVTPAEVAPVAAVADVVETAVGTVLVVAGRPRYHVEGCRYLVGKEPDEVDVADAREEGFTACGVCKPDLALERDLAAEQEPAQDEVASEDEVAEEVADEPTPVEVVPAARRATRKTAAPSTSPAPVVLAEPSVTLVDAPVTAPVKPVTTKAPSKAPAKAPAPTRAPAAKAPAGTSPAKAPAKTAATKTATKTAATKAAATKAPAKATTASAAKAAAAAAGVAPGSRPAAARGSVVVIPDRGKYHTSECRYVRGVDGAQVMTRPAATRAGYDACGVCKP